MTETMDIRIINGDVVVNKINDPTYTWPGPVGTDRMLTFERAYKIEPAQWGNGIENCVYRVHGREFKDLSFLKGETLEEYPDDYEIRSHEDGTRFLFSYKEIPTFDFDDRVWDGASHIAVYRDGEGLNLLHCRHGYEIPRIEVYIGLCKSVPAFADWVERLE